MEKLNPTTLLVLSRGLTPHPVTHQVKSGGSSSDDDDDDENRGMFPTLMTLTRPTSRDNEGANAHTYIPTVIKFNISFKLIHVITWCGVCVLCNGLAGTKLVADDVLKVVPKKNSEWRRKLHNILFYALKGLKLFNQGIIFRR